MTGDPAAGTVGEHWARLTALSHEVPPRVRAEVEAVLRDLRPVTEAVDAELGWPAAVELHTGLDTLRALVGLPVGDGAEE